jgi:signal transduction histidine kinase
MPDTERLIEKGSFSFSIESRIIRELGERLVKQGSIALLELVKNSYDADATYCRIELTEKAITVLDDGSGMTLNDFRNGWMRIGTSSKEGISESKKFGRPITGEKGIGRFAVRFLGTKLAIQSTAFDPARDLTTTLRASFDWPTFDKQEDLGSVKVPYTLRVADAQDPIGTRLTISALRLEADEIDLRSLRTASVGLVSPFQSLFRSKARAKKVSDKSGVLPDPGFSLDLSSNEVEETNTNLATTILDRFVLRADLQVRDRRFTLNIWEKGAVQASLSISDMLALDIGDVDADIRFFPQRQGTFINIPLDGRVAKGWVRDNSGIAVFDRRFRVHPYGSVDDDWLNLSRDTVKNERDPASAIAKKYFPMTPEVKGSTKLNYMLRLPHPQQLVGIVEVATARNRDIKEGLVPAADREGFVNNGAFRALQNLVRGAVEALAYIDREVQQRDERQAALLAEQRLEEETRSAIAAIESESGLSKSTRTHLVQTLVRRQEASENSQALSREREQTLETMSLLGVIAGFMTHEFGTAIDDLERAKGILDKLRTKHSALAADIAAIDTRIGALKEFVTYSQGYIRGAGTKPEKSYPVRPRIQQVMRVFGKYATDRNITVEIDIEADLMAPRLPVSLYNGIALNLYTNALKAVTSKSGTGGKKIAFRAWNSRTLHTLSVSDTGVGLPVALRERVFDPLFSTTASNKDPLGSGMGLGLTLVKRGVEAFGGSIKVVDPPPGFTTSFEVTLPLTEVR